MNRLVMIMLFLSATFFTFAQTDENDELRLIKKSDPKIYSTVPVTSYSKSTTTTDAESVEASYNNNDLFISFASFTGAVTIEVLDANNLVVITDTRKIVKQAVLTYSIGKLRPGVYTLVVTASGEYSGEFEKKSLDKTVITRESLVLSSLSYQ